MLTLYYYPGNANLLPHMLLREIGVPFALKLVDREVGAHEQPDYLALNPSGRIPVLVDGDRVIFETAAIVLYLVERFPEAGLAPPVGSPQWITFVRWLIHLTNTPQPEFRAFFYPDHYVDDPAAVASVNRRSAERLTAMFDVIAVQLGEGPWLLGDQLSAADFFLLMLVRWGRSMPHPPRDVPALAAHAARLLARPAVLATFEAEGLQAPYI